VSTLTFDTLKFANQLKTAGVLAGHAETKAKALSEACETNLSELATKEDLRHEIKELASALRQEMSGMKFELLKWLIGLAVAQAGLIIGLLKFFPD
jgi:hypothetical protein